MTDPKAEIKQLRKELFLLKKTLAKTILNGTKGKTFGQLGNLLVEELGAAISAAVTMREALRSIANDPCLNPEGNAEIARVALESATLHVMDDKDDDA